MSLSNVSGYQYIMALTLRLLLVSFILFSQMVLAQDEEAGSNDESGDSASDGEVKAEELRPVEVGVGGIIKPENKYRTEIEDQFEAHLHLLWESRYVSEGRDNLQGKNLLSVSSEFVLGDIYFVPWYAHSAAANYSELDLNFVYGKQWTDSFSVYIGYNHIRAREQGENASDNEINIDLSYEWQEKLYLFSTVYHSFSADGTFMEVAVKPGKRLNSKVYVGAQFLLGLNADYIPDGHNGVNHFQVRANVSYNPRAKMELYAYTAYNQAVNRDAEKYPGDELLGNFFWGGAGFTYRF